MDKKKIHSSLFLSSPFLLIPVGAFLYLLIGLLSILDLQKPTDFARLIQKPSSESGQYTQQIPPVLVFLLEFILVSITTSIFMVIVFFYLQHAVMMCTMGMGFIASTIFAIFLYMAMFYISYSSVDPVSSPTRPTQPTNYYIFNYQFSDLNIIASFILFSIMLYIGKSLWYVLAAVLLADFVRSIIFTIHYRHSFRM